MGASVVLISGCQDSQYSRDGDRNGLFTQRLREVWADGTFAKGHRAFYRAICELMPPDQTPNYFRVGKTSSELRTEGAVHDLSSVLDRQTLVFSACQAFDRRRLRRTAPRAVIP